MTTRDFLHSHWRDAVPQRWTKQEVIGFAVSCLLAGIILTGP